VAPQLWCGATEILVEVTKPHFLPPPSSFVSSAFPLERKWLDCDDGRAGTKSFDQPAHYH
jgi:hypothetical protein